jgi:hypothetical protein
MILTAAAISVAQPSQAPDRSSFLAMTGIPAARVGLLVLGLLCVPGAHAAQAASKKPWGAVAYNSKTGAFGYAVDRTNKRDAEAEAFRQCGSDCDLIRTFRNSCGAVAHKPRKFAWETGASREIAERKALTRCGGEPCKIAVWACTSQK